MTAEARPAARNILPKAEPIRVWFPTLVCVAIACAVFAVAFQHEIVGAYAVWVGSTAYNHCFLVLPLIGVMLWSRRSTIVLLQPRPQPLALILIPFVLVLWTAAALVGVLEAEQLLVVCLFEVLLIAVLGWQCFRALLGPLLFLFFLVPFGAFLVPTLQQFTAGFTVQGLQLLGIPVFADGLLIEIPQGSFEIAEACAGLRFLIASIVFGCFFATIIYQSPYRRAIFIGLSIIVPIVANGMRALGLVVLAHLEGSSTAVAADHVIYGWLFFTVVTVLLIVIGMSFSESIREPRPVVGAPTWVPRNFRLGTTMTVGLLLVLVGPAYLAMLERAMALPTNFRLLAPPTGDWVHQPNTEIGWQPAAPGASRSFLDTYSQGSAQVSQFVALFPLPARDSPLSRSGSAVAEAQNWQIVSSGHASVPNGNNHLALDTAIVAKKPQQHRLVWWFYVVDNRMTASPLVAKLMQARAAVTGGPHAGAVIAVSTEIDDPASAKALLTRFFEATPSLQDLHPVALTR